MRGVVGGQPPEGGLAAGEDHPQQVVEVVNHLARDPPDGGKVLGLAEVLLQTALQVAQFRQGDRRLGEPRGLLGGPRLGPPLRFPGRRRRLLLHHQVASDRRGGQPQHQERQELADAHRVGGLPRRGPGLRRLAGQVAVRPGAEGGKRSASASVSPCICCVRASCRRSLNCCRVRNCTDCSARTSFRPTSAVISSSEGRTAASFSATRRSCSRARRAAAAAV